MKPDRIARRRPRPSSVATRAAVGLLAVAGCCAGIPVFAAGPPANEADRTATNPQPLPPHEKAPTDAGATASRGALRANRTTAVSPVSPVQRAGIIIVGGRPAAPATGAAPARGR